MTLSVDVSSVERPNTMEQIALAYGMMISDDTSRMLRMKMNGRRRPNLLRQRSLARPITGTRKNPSPGPMPSIMLMFCSLPQQKTFSQFIMYVNSLNTHSQQIYDTTDTTYRYNKYTTVYKTYNLDQCCPTHGPRAACGPRGDSMWPAIVPHKL